MINLYYVEKILGPSVQTNLVAVPCSVKKFKYVAPAAGAGGVLFKDGGPSGRAMARLSASAGTSDELSCNTNEVFNFATSVYVEVTGAQPGASIGVYLLGNPVGP